MTLPLEALPTFEFPLNDQRKSGLLPPYVGVTGKSGPEISLPYYLNLAPNYDATLTEFSEGDVVTGKVVRIDPLGRNSTNTKYGIPAANPFVADNNPSTLGEIYAYGVRNPQRFGWDRTNGNMYMAEIGQNLIEEVSQITRGGNLGWNDWEASYKFISRTELDLTKHRADPKVTFPIAEFDHKDALFPTGRVAATGLIVYRGTQIPQLSGLLIFGDNPSGEVFYVSADRLPAGGQDPIRRILFTQGAATKTFQIGRAHV